MFAIGEASRQSGVSIETIRYYEREGIVPPPERSANGRRIYSAEAIGRLKFLKNCRNLGFSLSDAKALLELSVGEHSDCDTVSRMGDRQLASTRKKIAELRRLEAALTELTANCSEGNTNCPMLDALRGG